VQEPFCIDVAPVWGPFSCTHVVSRSRLKCRLQASTANTNCPLLATAVKHLFSRFQRRRRSPFAQGDRAALKLWVESRPASECERRPTNRSPANGGPAWLSCRLSTSKIITQRLMNYHFESCTISKGRRWPTGRMRGYSHVSVV
jgi:hypothetical protein